MSRIIGNKRCHLPRYLELSTGDRTGRGDERASTDRKNMVNRNLKNSNSIGTHRSSTIVVNGARNCSLPNWILICISQTLATLSNNSLPGSAQPRKSLRGQPTRLRIPPNESVGVEQEFHASPVQNPSGSGTSKSWLGSNAPGCKSGTRGSITTSTGTRRATGFPA